MRHLILALIVLLFFSICSSPLLAQPEAPPAISWFRTYGAAQGNGAFSQFYDIYRTPAGYAMPGVSSTEQGGRAWFLLTDGDGDPAIDRLYADEDNQGAQLYGRSVIDTDDGGFLMGISGMNGNATGQFDMLKLDGEGNSEWYRTVCTYRPNLTGCYAVIELKAGAFCGAGMGRIAGGPLGRAFAAVVPDNDEDDPNWATDFSIGFFRGMREVADEGIIYCGFGSGRTLLKTNFNGEEIWRRIYEDGALHAIISDPQGGYAACGIFQGNFGLLKVDHDGERIWDGTYSFEGIQRSVAQGLARFRDGGYILGGGFTRDDMQPVGAVVRTDADGNLIWQLRLDDLPEPWDEYIVEGIENVLVEPDGSVIMAGGCSRLDENNNRVYEGVLLKLFPDRSPPRIVEWHPEELELEVLSGDTVEFWVRVEDLQGDSVSYVWTNEEDTLSTDTSLTIAFNDLGDYNLQCKVFDVSGADSIAWEVRVEDLYISAYQPDSLLLNVRRNTRIDFSIETRAIAGDPIQYEWLLDNEQVGSENSVSLEFMIGRERVVQANAFRNEQWDSQIWRVTVVSPIGLYYPENNNFSARIDSLLRFWVDPFFPESDSLTYLWLKDGDTVSFEQAVELQFSDQGEHRVTAFLQDGSELDSVEWRIQIYIDDNVRDASPFILPSFLSLSAFPNPFNSTTTISYSLPSPGRYAIDVVDIRGRLVANLSDGWKEAGSYHEVWDASQISQGTFFARINTNAKSKSVPILLIK